LYQLDSQVFLLGARQKEKDEIGHGNKRYLTFVAYILMLASKWEQTVI
jgi:hypothetical protein